MTTEQNLLSQARNKFLTERAREEAKVQAWADSLSKVDPSLLRDIKLPSPLTLETLTPEVYKDSPDPVVYEQQYNAAMELIAKVNAIGDEYNRRGLQVLEEYNKLCN